MGVHDLRHFLICINQPELKRKKKGNEGQASESL